MSKTIQLLPLLRNRPSIRRIILLFEKEDHVGYVAQHTSIKLYI